MAPVLTNNATSTLAGSIIASATSFSVASGDAARFPSPGAGQWFPLTVSDNAGNMEIMRCTARSGAALTVVRAQEGTTASAFDAGARVTVRYTSAVHAAVMDLIAALQDGKSDTGHGHAIENVAGLIEALAGKLGTGAKAADAELLDGQEGAHYLNATNMNAGVLPDTRNRAPLTIGGESITNWNAVAHNGWFRSNRGLDSVIGTPDGGSGTRYWLGTSMNFGAGDAWRRQILWAIDTTGAATETWTRIAQPGVGWHAWERIRATQAELDSLYAGIAASNIFTSSQRVGGAGTGHTVQAPGGPSNAGFIGVHMPDGTRRGYLGFSSGGFVQAGGDGWRWNFDHIPVVGGNDIIHAATYRAYASSTHSTEGVGSLVFAADLSRSGTGWCSRGTLTAGSSLWSPNHTNGDAGANVVYNNSSALGLSGTWMSLARYHTNVGAGNAAMTTLWLRVA